MDDTTINAICDALENVTQSVRTRKTGEKQTSDAHKGLPTDKQFKYPNESKEWYYKYEQITAEHRFDCDKLRKAPNGLKLLCGGVTSTAIIDSQKIGRALTVEAFAKRYNNADGVTIDLFDALATNVKEVKPETVTKQIHKLSKEQQIKLANEQMSALGLVVGDDGTLVPKQ